LRRSPAGLHYLVSTNTIPAMAANLVDLTKMIDPIRSGDRSAPADWLQTFLPGTCFLIRRRLGKPDVDAEARSVLAAALLEVRADATVMPDQIPGLIRRLICQRYPGKPSEYAGSSNTARTKDAERILNRMSPVERDALRRCYVLGEAPELILSGLKLTVEEFRKIRSRARAEFSVLKPKQANVA
jgi:DNA-directed RNA polymerase specialized sigma24 family protein